MNNDYVSLLGNSHEMGQYLETQTRHKKENNVKRTITSAEVISAINISYAPRKSRAPVVHWRMLPNTWRCNISSPVL